MRLATTVLVLLSLGTAVQAAILPSNRDDLRSFDVCVRRLEQAGEGDAEAVLEHLRPMMIRRGGPMGNDRIEIGSVEETDLVSRQVTRAGESRDRGEIAEKLAIGFFRRAWNIVWGVLTAIFPGLGTLIWIVGLVGVYLLYRRVKAALLAMYRDAEKLPQGQRREVFTSPEVVKDYNRRNKNGKNRKV